jgi:polyisoprenoid-binding protein YceI
MKNGIVKYSLLLLLMAAFSVVSAQAQHHFTVQDNSKLSVAGTSTLHDWESDATKLSGTAHFVLNDRNITAIEDLTLTVGVKSIESGKSGMDKKTYDALNANKYPNITYTFKDLKSVSGNKVTAAGTLEIAGKKKTVEFPVTYQVNADNSVNFKGEVDLKMTSFDIEPPSALLGTVTAGDDIKIKFDVTYK